MKKRWILLSFILSFAQADAPQKIDMPSQPPAESPAQANPNTAPPAPVSTTETDQKDTTWKVYENRIVKAHWRVKSSWLMMEIKETRESGSVSFTLTRLPFVTFAVSREPIQGDLDLYLTSASLADIYASGFKKSSTIFAGRKAFLVRGMTRDGRQDETYFATDEHSIYQVSFSAPEGFWKEASPQFAEIKQSFRWLP